MKLFYCRDQRARFIYILLCVLKNQCGKSVKKKIHCNYNFVLAFSEDTINKYLRILCVESVNK